MAFLLKAEAEPVEVQPANGKSFSLQELQGFVGGYIEIVRCGRPEFAGGLLVLDEEGKLKQKRLNLLATYAYAAPDDVIVGDALLCLDGEVE